MADTLPESPAPARGEFSIRRATAADASTLGALSAELFLDTFVRGFGIPYSAWDIECFVEAAHSPAAYAAMLADPALALWLAEDPVGAAVGYAVVGPCGVPVDGANPAHGELRRLYVRQAAQGQGVAPRLMHETLTFLRADERPIWLGVWSGNLRAQRFYARYGFEKMAEFDYRVGETVDREFAMRRTARPF